MSLFAFLNLLLISELALKFCFSVIEGGLLSKLGFVLLLLNRPLILVAILLVGLISVALEFFFRTSFLEFSRLPLAGTRVLGSGLETDDFFCGFKVSLKIFCFIRVFGRIKDSSGSPWLSMVSLFLCILGSRALYFALTRFC